MANGCYIGKCRYGLFLSPQKILWGSAIVGWPGFRSSMKVSQLCGHRPHSGPLFPCLKIRRWVIGFSETEECSCPQNKEITRQGYLVWRKEVVHWENTGLKVKQLCACGEFLLHNKNVIDTRMSSGQLPVPSYVSLESVSKQQADESLRSLHSALHGHILWETEKPSQTGALSGRLWPAGSGRRINTVKHLEMNTRVVTESGSRRYTHSTE